jgi:phage FluMu gp28-like protein
MPLSSSNNEKFHNWKEEMLGKVLMPYQARYLTDTSPMILVEKSRRVGVTWSCALKSIVRRISRDTRIDHVFSSKDEDTGKEWLGYCKFFAEQINFLFGQDQFIPTKQWTSERGIYPNGSRAIVISSSPKAFRSHGGDVTIDEFDFHENQRDIYTAAEPCLTWHPDAYLEIVSSKSKIPGSQFKLFCREAKGANETGWSLHRVTLEDAVEQGLALKIWKNRIPEFESPEQLNAAFLADKKRRAASLEDYLVEYMCEEPASSALISEKDYDALVLKGPDGNPADVPDHMESGRAYGPLYVGIDCGRVHDLTVVWVLEQGYHDKYPQHLRDVFRPVCVKLLRNMPFPAQLEAIRPIVTHPAICKGFIDMGSVGRALADGVADETGSVIEPYAMTPIRMAQMAERLRAFVQQHRIAQHPDPFVRKDVLCVHRNTVQNVHGSPRLVYEGSTEISHGDSFWAQALALEAACQATGIGLAVSREVEMAQPQLAVA